MVGEVRLSQLSRPPTREAGGSPTSVPSACELGRLRGHPTCRLGRGDPGVAERGGRPEKASVFDGNNYTSFFRN